MHVEVQIVVSGFLVDDSQAEDPGLEDDRVNFLHLVMERVFHIALSGLGGHGL